MKAKITKISEVRSNLTQHIDFDIIDDNDEPLVSMNIDCMPSEAEMYIKKLLANYTDEYNKSLELQVGTEIV